ncbi:MAG: hypothetical protein R3A46_08175 [Thermomicrobiales bacterium]
MPHVHHVEILDRRDDRTLARIDARRGWVPVRFLCGFARDEERGVMHRWYIGWPWGGIIETWRVSQDGDGLIELRCSILARGWFRRLIAWLVIAPIARRQFEMIDLLAVAHRRSQDADGWG